MHQQIVAFPDALSNVPKSNLFKRIFDGSFEIETSPIDKVIESSIAEEEFDAAENRFDRVELRRVGDVENRLDVKALHFFNRPIACVH